MVSIVKPSIFVLEKCMTLSRRNIVQGSLGAQCNPRCSLGAQFSAEHGTLQQGKSILHDTFGADVLAENRGFNILKKSHPEAAELKQSLLLVDLDPATAKLAIGLIGPFLSAFAFLFILRIVMSWYPKLPVGKFPYVLAYAPTEPLLVPTRKLIPPLGGVDITPVVWFGLISFLNEILVGPQGLLVLLSQQV
ncbi:Protein COFACTOR ASSEMBLY OF COMPLEX C SUBUNIT B ccb3, chloroplastic [Ancistrocladus abbreviatus]